MPERGINTVPLPATPNDTGIANPDFHHLPPFNLQLDHLISRLSDQGVNDPYMFWAPGHIVNGLLDYKASLVEPEASTMHPLVREASELALAFYQGGVALDRIVELGQKIADVPDLSATKVGVEYHGTSVLPAIPEVCNLVASALCQYVKKADILFVPLARGGTTPGLLTYAFYQAINQQTNSLVFPVRFSHDKGRDEVPVVSEAEIDYLKTNVEGKELVVFDCDVATGQTLSIATAFFSRLLGKEAIPIANLDMDYLKWTDSIYLLGTEALEKKKIEAEERNWIWKVPGRKRPRID